MKENDYVRKKGGNTVTPENVEVTIGRHGEKLHTLEERVEKMGLCVEAIKTNVNRILGGSSYLLHLNCSEHYIYAGSGEVKKWKTA